MALSHLVFGRGHNQANRTQNVAVVRVSWNETESKGSNSEIEQKTLTLVAHGMTGAKTRAPNRGEAFSLWRLLKR